MDVERGRLERVSVHLRLARKLWTPALDERDVRRRAAQVEGDEIAKAGEPADLEPADDAGRRARQDGADRLRACRLEGHHASVALRDVGHRGHPGIDEPPPKACEVAFHYG